MVLEHLEHLENIGALGEHWSTWRILEHLENITQNTSTEAKALGEERNTLLEFLAGHSFYTLWPILIGPNIWANQNSAYSNTNLPREFTTSSSATLWIKSESSEYSRTQHGGADDSKHYQTYSKRDIDLNRMEFIEYWGRTIAYGTLFHEI